MRGSRSPTRRRASGVDVRRSGSLKHFVVHIEGDALVVYTSSYSPADTDDLIERIDGPSFRGARAEEYRDKWIKRSQYMKMLGSSW
jgi:hypothetical protein